MPEKIWRKVSRVDRP